MVGTKRRASTIDKRRRKIQKKVIKRRRKIQKKVGKKLKRVFPIAFQFAGEEIGGIRPL